MDFSPTGTELVTGSYDKSIRIYRTNEGHARDVYHTKRMQRVFCAKFSMDNQYILSGSDDGNVRLWKSQSSQKMGILSAREKSHHEYQEKLKNRYAHLPEMRKVAKSRNIPKAIKQAQGIKRIMLDSRKRKVDNERKHRKEGAVPYVAERKEIVLAKQA